MRLLPAAVAVLLSGFVCDIGGSGRAVACSDLQLPLGDELSRPRSRGDQATRDLALFMVRGMVARPDSAVVDGGDAWTVRCDGLAPEIRAALTDSIATDGVVDPAGLTRAFEAHYLETLEQRDHQEWIKATVLEMARATGFRSWSSTVVEFSMVKRKTRHIFRSPVGFEPEISVSQTLDSESGDLQAAVLETEVAVLRPDGRDWDFYAYDVHGDLATFSTFPAGERPAPLICVGCHYDSESRGVRRFFP